MSEYPSDVPYWVDIAADEVVERLGEFQEFATVVARLSETNYYESDYEHILSEKIADVIYRRLKEALNERFLRSI